MMFTKATLTFFALAIGARAAITVSTPSDTTTCQPIEFTVGGDATGTLLANVMKSSEPCGTPVTEDIAIDPTTKKFKWTATAPGAYVVVVDNELEEGWSATFNIASSGSESCSDANTGSEPTTHTNTNGSGASATGTGTGNRGTNNTPANAAPNTGDDTNESAQGAASRTAVGGVTALAFIGAVAAALSI